MKSSQKIDETQKTKAQTAIEYLLLLAIVVSVVLVSFRVLLPRASDIGDNYFNRVAEGIMGAPVPSPDFPPPPPPTYTCSGGGPHNCDNYLGTPSSCNSLSPSCTWNYSLDYCEGLFSCDGLNQTSCNNASPPCSWVVVSP